MSPRPPEGEARFDVERATRICFFFEHFLHHSKGELAGKLFTLAPWQRWALGQIFGWVRPNGLRWYERADLWLPRKNGKSTLCAGVAIYLLAFDGEPGAQVISQANEKAQAKTVLDEAMSMVEKSPDLSERLQLFRGVSSILDPLTASAYWAVSGKGKTKDSYNLHGLVSDEIHELRDHDLYDKLTTSMGSRRQPLHFNISTAGEDPTTIGAHEYDIDKKIVKGEVSLPHRFVMICEARENDDWRDEKVWRGVNLNWGVSLIPERVRSEFDQAVVDPAKESMFKRYRLNIWTSSTITWMDMDAWNLCSDDVPDAELEGQPCWGGVDLSSRIDLTARVLVFRVGDKYVLRPRVWVPGDNIIEKEKRDKVPYRLWAKQKLLTLCDGNVIDYTEIEDDLKNCAERYAVTECAFDPQGSNMLVQRLQDAGINCVEVIQTTKYLSHPTKELKALVKQRRIMHGGNPILKWMIRNARAWMDGNENIRLSKKSSTSRIDAVAATVTAMARVLAIPEVSPMYDKDGEGITIA